MPPSVPTAPPRRGRAHAAAQAARSGASATARPSTCDALVDARIAQRRGDTPSPARVPAHAGRGRERRRTLLLIDSSASTARPWADGSGSVLDAACRIAWASAARWPHSAIHASCSDGRHAVHYLRLKDFAQPLDAACWHRLQALQGRLSTRLGAALRHATQLLAARRAPQRRLLLITDGRPQDIDVHDPRYLLEDARQAVREAARRGVTPAVPEPGCGDAASRCSASSVPARCRC